MTKTKPQPTVLPRTPLVRITLGGALSFGLLLASGCSFFKTDANKEDINSVERVVERATENVAKADREKEQEQVRFDGGLLLGKTDEAAFTPVELANALGDLIEAEKWTSARGLVAMYPDIVVKILFGESGNLQPRQLDSIASLFDQKWQQPDAKATWTEFVSRRYSDQTLVGYFAKRAKFLELVSNNQPGSALALKLPSSLQESDALAIADACRLEGIANLMLEKFGPSIQRLEQSVSILEHNHPYQASQSMLLLGEAQRHAKLLADWKSTWIRAVEHQSQLLERKRLKSPEFWKKAAFLRPVATSWPPTTISRMKRSLTHHNLNFGSEQTIDDEAVIWAVIGVQSLQRHESENAILALKKSEALVAANQLKTELQLHQAMAMINGGQSGPASAILLRIGSTPSISGDRAKAILATLKLQQGSLAQGMNLLQSAIKSSQQWPEMERLRSQADYALSYLMRGREKQGIALLNHVYDEFVNLGEFDQAIQCLSNLAMYYEKTDKAREYRLAIAKLKQLEAL